MTTDYRIGRGGHEDLHRVYPMMCYDFESWERPTEAEFHAAMLKGAELLLLKDGEGRECGYALMLKSRGAGYVLLGWLGVYPNVRGHGVGGVFLSLLNEWYSALDGILLEVTKYPELEKARKLHAFYQRNGYGDVDCAYTCYGAPTALMYCPLAGAPDISAQVKAIMKDCYLPLYSEKQQAEYIGIN